MRSFKEYLLERKIERMLEQLFEKEMGKTVDLKVNDFTFVDNKFLNVNVNVSTELTDDQKKQLCK